MNVEIPKACVNTPPRLNRTLFEITAVLFGLTGSQDWEAELSPGPETRIF
jgi:hypothetical protein